MSTRSFRYSSMSLHTPKSMVASTDRDALAFLEAATIYNTNQQRAIIRLVRDLKRTGLWTKMKAIYPFVGGTATTHKWNLKDPRDLDAAFRLSFVGGWTHSSTGADPNGTNAYADTYIKCNTVLSLNSNHASYYSRENTTTSNSIIEIGTADNSSELPTFALMMRFANGVAYWQSPDYNQTRPNFTPTSSSGYQIGSRTSSSSNKIYKNGVLQATNTNTSSQNALPNNYNLPIGAYIFIGGVSGYTNRECAFATIGDGVTDTDATNLYNIVDLYQKRLGRAV